jgi:hypothetical protein
MNIVTAKVVADEVATGSHIGIELLAISLNNLQATISINLPMMLAAFVAVAVVWVCIQRKYKNYSATKIKLNMPFKTGSVEITPNYQEKLIAHQIWTELVTRKAALPFERDKDVIIEVYDSWYTLFGVVRNLIREIPIEKLHGAKKESIEQLTMIALNVLNDGLRPHLTQWQTKYRAWYDEQDKAGVSPQDIQKQYQHYDDLVTDIERVNGRLASFSDDLKKIVSS